MAISTAIDLTRISRAVGYKLKKANFTQSTPYLPQRIAVLGEANDANQSGLTVEPFEFTSAAEVGAKYGYGSPLHQMARILRPISGDLLGGIPTVIYPQISDGAASETVLTLGVAAGSDVTANATHYLVINGRRGIDGFSYAFSPAVGDTAAEVAQKIVDAVNGVLASPVIATRSVANVVLTTKWTGITSAELNATFDTQDVSAGIVYSEVSKVDGAGVVDLANTLALFTEWNTLLLNPYGSAQFDTLEAFNGIPDPTTPTGRFNAVEWKPFMAFFGSVLDTKAGVIAITDDADRKTQVTNVHCPAPNSTGFTWEAAANMMAVFAPVAQNNPHLGVGGLRYPDMPTPEDSDIGDFANYADRDYMVKRGSSTVKLTDGKFEIQDLVTTYHPTGEEPPKFRFVRDMNVYFNNAFSWILIMLRDIQDRVIVDDSSPVRVGSTVSPKQVRQLIASYAVQQEERALLADSEFTIDSSEVGINESNPARLDIFFRTKITSTANIVSTDNEFDFNFSS